MDELSFGPSREPRQSREPRWLRGSGEPRQAREPRGSDEPSQPPRRRRPFPAAASLALAAAAGIAFVVTHGAASQQPPSQPTASPYLLSHLPPKGCAPTSAAWPTLTALPAGMRPGALPVIADAQFSGRCPPP